MEWLNNILRSLFFFLDKVIYSFIEQVYMLFMDIANTSIFTDTVVQTFFGKIYGLVGIFMLFKVSFSILTYVVYPDEFTDKNKGIKKLARNIIISLALLLFVPYAFSYAMKIQKIVLKDNIIPKLFTVEYTTVDADGTEHKHLTNISTNNPGQGTQIAFLTFSAFYTPKDNAGSLADMFATDVNERDTNDNYVNEYHLLWSTATGVIIVLLLVSFCFDIAVRSVKLGCLRILAPIPILARLDPKKGDEIFNKWVKTCVSTYLDLFMRLIAIFFAVYIIQAMQHGLLSDAVTGESANVGFLVQVFIILGALTFAKQVPKLLEDMFGFKLSGKFTLNPLRKAADVPIAGKLANVALGTADSVIHGNGLWAGVKRNWNNISWGGADGKTSIFSTADAKLRRDVKEKADTARQKYEGKHEFNEIDDNWKKGNAIFDKLLSRGVADPGKAFDGTTRRNYEIVFHHQEFIDSKIKLDAADEHAKLIAQAYSKAEIDGWHGPTLVDGKIYSTLDELIEENTKAGKVKAGLEKVHETMRKQYQDDAKREDQHKFRKNNSSNPAH